MIAPRAVYSSREPYELVMFDLRIPGNAERLHRERATWQEYSDIEALDGDHFILVIRAGGAQELAA